MTKCEEEGKVAPEMTQSLEWMKTKREIINKIIGFYNKCLVETSMQNNLKVPECH